MTIHDLKEIVGLLPANGPITANSLRSAIHNHTVERMLDAGWTVSDQTDAGEDNPARNYSQIAAASMAKSLIERRPDLIPTKQSDDPAPKVSRELTEQERHCDKIPCDFRKLEFGEVIQRGDYHWAYGDGPWECSNTSVGLPIRAGHHVHIRYVGPQASNREPNEALHTLLANAPEPPMLVLSEEERQELCAIARQGFNGDIKIIFPNKFSDWSKKTQEDYMRVTGVILGHLNQSGKLTVVPSIEGKTPVEYYTDRYNDHSGYPVKFSDPRLTKIVNALATAVREDERKKWKTKLAHRDAEVAQFKTQKDALIKELVKLCTRCELAGIMNTDEARETLANLEESNADERIPTH